MGVKHTMVVSRYILTFIYATDDDKERKVNLSCLKKMARDGLEFRVYFI